MKFLVAVALATIASVQAGCFPEGVRPPTLSYEEKVALAYNHQPVDAENGGHHGHGHHFPREFDWEDVEGVNYLAPSWNQHIPVYCGSCWLHATLSSVQDRIKIKKRARGVDTMLARQVLLQCGPLANMSNGCHGGEPRNVFDYMKDFGLPDETCMLYKADDQQFMHLKKEGKQCPAEGRCWNCMHGHKPECFAIENPLVYRVESYGPIEPKEEAIMAEVYKRGPVVCSMATTDDFDYGYHGGVHVPAKPSDDVNHDVEIVGWGVDEDGTKYWRVRNSWGTYWGEKGFFRIRRGENDYHIEDDCWYAVPSWEMEHELDEGKLVGDMVKGLIKNPKWEEMEKKIKEFEEKEKAEEEKIKEEIKKRMEEREKELEEMKKEMEKMREEQAEQYRERMRERIQRLREEAERRRHRYEEVFGEEGEIEEEGVAERMHEREEMVGEGVRLSAMN